jgi:hypothetical protein
MKRNMIALGLCAGLLSGPALAADVLVYDPAPPPSGSPVYAKESLVSGDALAAIGYYWWNDRMDRYDTDVAEAWGAARLNLPIAGALNQEFEVSGLVGLESDSYYSYGAFSHTYLKTPGSAVGLLLGGSSLNGNGLLTVGGEGAIFLPTTTFTGLLAYNWGDGIPDFWAAQGEARWYWNADTRISGSVGYKDLGGTWAFTAGLEHRLPGTLVSLFADGTYYTDDTGHGWELFAGGRLFLDKPGQTLQGHDHEVPFSAARAITF